MSNTSLSNTISDVINTFVDEVKQRSKRQLHVILNNVKESSADDGQRRKEQDINTASSVFDKYMGVKPRILNAHRIGKKVPRLSVQPRFSTYMLS